MAVSIPIFAKWNQLQMSSLPRGLPATSFPSTILGLKYCMITDLRQKAGKPASLAGKKCLRERPNLEFLAMEKKLRKSLRLSSLNLVIFYQATTGIKHSLLQLGK